MTLQGIKTGAAVNLDDIDESTPGNEISIPTAGNDAVGITMHRMEQPDVSGNYFYRALVPA